MRYFSGVSGLLFLWLIIGHNVDAQISSGTADAEKPIAYKSYTGNDKVFVFYSPPGEIVKGSLRADAPYEANFNFEWSVYNPDLAIWSTPFKTETEVAFSAANNLDEGGYRVRVSNGADIDTFLYGWVFIDNLMVDVEETIDGKVKPFKYTCDFLILNGAVYADSFFYYDPVSNERIRLLNDYTFLWDSDNPDLIIPNATRVLSPNTNYRPPFIDTWFVLTATDSFGMQDVDSVFYETIHVKSDFTMEFFDKKEDPQEYIAAPNPTEDDAPLKVRFTNASINGYSFEWIFEDTTEADVFANELTEDVNYQPEYTYKFPEDYYPRLVAKSEEGCIDTFKVEEPIVILPSKLEVANVFSPNKDGTNDFFKPSFMSIKEFHIRIYSHTGNLVYKKDITDLYSWDGWDGNIMNSNRPAPSGVYYYVIEATGYDEERYNRGPYKGAVHLFRGRD